MAGRFLIDMLGGISPFGHELGLVACIDWQARDSGRLLDDLAVTLDAADGAHTAEMSIKSHRQVTGSGFPDNFVEAVWEEWFHTATRTFRKDRDLLVLATGEIANDVIEAWSTLLRESLATDPDRMVSRLQDRVGSDEGAQSSAAERALFASLRCPETLKDHGPSNQVVTVEVIRRIRLLHFDFQSEPSRDEGRAIADCRALLRSGELAEAQRLWKAVIGLAAENREVGGSLDLAGLLTRLRPAFELIDHPDFRADWQALERATRDVLDDVRTEIGGVTTVNREKELGAVSSALTNLGICLAAGESGCGKSALAKMLGTSGYGSTIALPFDLFEAGGRHRLEQELGLRHSLVDILSAGRTSCLFILDSMERCSEQGLRLVGRIIADLLADERCRHVHILITMQFDAANRVITRLVDAGVERSKLDITPIDFPPESVIRDLLRDVRGVPWATLHQEMRPLLRNLKILDWVVRAAQSGEQLNPSDVTGLPSLIEYLWGRWIEVDHDGISRGGLLKKIATIEAATLVNGVPVSRLEHAEQQSLSALISAELLRRRDERVRFAHDLLGDWARLRVLIGEDPTTSKEGLERCSTARWHRAVRLWGRWLLAQANGVERWSQAIGRANNGSDASTVVHDLLLESVVLCENARRILALAWPVLIESQGRLLKRLLDRFMFVATIPDLRLPKLVQDAHVSPQLEAAFRVPVWPYWGGVLQTLNDHLPDLCRVAPVEAAKLCRMWLEKTPSEVAPETRFPWRVEASRMALQLAREMQGLRAEGRHIDDHEDRVAYEGALLAAPDLPDEVAAFALEMAERRPMSADIQDRADAANVAAEENRRRLDVEDPDRAARIANLGVTALPRGEWRGPWPDGPARRVESAFAEAVLEGTVLTSLAAVRPDAAFEALLAVCIEPPGYEDTFGSHLSQDCGLEHWREHEPAMYFRGPFLQLLRLCPAQAVDFTIRLINFASARWYDSEARYRERRGPPPIEGFEDDDLSVVVHVGADAKVWKGDRRVFRWHLDWPVDCKVITCTLMALERWLYEQIDTGTDIHRWLELIVERSESVAFAGLLIDVGKREPQYFATSLRPLLGTSAFHLWEPRILMERSTTALGLMGWWNQPRDLIDLARDWHTAPHRKTQLSAVATLLMFNSPEVETFLLECRERWRHEIDPTTGEPRLLQILIEQFDRRNYQETPTDDGRVRIQFVPPNALMRQVEVDQRKSDESMRLLTFPMNCRQILDGEKSLPLDDVSVVWDTLQSIARQILADEEDGSRQAAAVAGGIAVLLKLHRNWLVANSERLTWAITQLRQIVDHPPQRREFDFPETVGDTGWDCFVSEACVCLLQDVPEGEFVRECVALGIAGYHYGTTLKTMHLAHERRDQLGENFAAMQHLAVRWSLIRRLRRQCGQYLGELQQIHAPAQGTPDDSMSEQLKAEYERWDAEYRELIERFIRGDTRLTTLDEVAKIGVVDAERLAMIRFPARKARSRRAQQRTWHRSRSKIRRLDPGLDNKVLTAAFSWLDLSQARSESERKNVLHLVHQLLALVIDSLQLSDEANPDEAEDDVEIDGLPDDFDGWVFGVVSKTIVQMRDDEQPSSLWHPILSLGTHAREWIGRFFWSWFSDGFQASGSSDVFAARWTQMLEFALTSSLWNPSEINRHDLDEKVFEMMGYHFGLHSVAATDGFAPALKRMFPVLEQAAQRWFAMPRVANGFARSVTEPGYDLLLCPGIVWLHRAMTSADEYDFWRQHGIESNLTSALSRCWERYHETVAADAELQAAFLGLLTALASRGSHPAMALRERLLDSIRRAQ